MRYSSTTRIGKEDLLLNYTIRWILLITSFGKLNHSFFTIFLVPLGF